MHISMSHIHVLVVLVANKKLVKHGSHFTIFFPILSQENLENLPNYKVRIPDHKLW